MPTSQPWGGSEWVETHMHTTHACEKQPRPEARCTVYTSPDKAYCSLNNSKVHSSDVCSVSLARFFCRIVTFPTVLRAVYSLHSLLGLFFLRGHHRRHTFGSISWDRAISVSHVATSCHFQPKLTDMIGQIASTGSPFPPLYDLSLSAAKSGASHRTVGSWNTLFRTYREEFRIGCAHYAAETPPSCLSRFQLLDRLRLLH